MGSYEKAVKIHHFVTEYKLSFNFKVFIFDIYYSFQKMSLLIWEDTSYTFAKSR